MIKLGNRFLKSGMVRLSRFSVSRKTGARGTSQRPPSAPQSDAGKFHSVYRSRVVLYGRGVRVLDLHRPAPLPADLSEFNPPICPKTRCKTVQTVQQKSSKTQGFSHRLAPCSPLELPIK
jgi:hypothetical protein